MKFRLSQRGIVLAEFAIALPLLILLLGALGIVTLNALKIAREQVADYTLETEAQYVMDRITSDARAAYSAEIQKITDDRNEIFFTYNVDFDTETRRYSLSSPHGRYCVYAERLKDGPLTNPITGENDYGRTFVTQLKFKISKKILHVTLEMESDVTHKKVHFNTAVYMPSYSE